MSSYLIAVVVSDFPCILGVANAGLNGSLPISVCARPNAINQTTFSLDVAVKIIEYFQSLYGLKFPLPKCGKYIY